jgi:hypothetical protein
MSGLSLARVALCAPTLCFGASAAAILVPTVCGAIRNSWQVADRTQDLVQCPEKCLKLRVVNTATALGTPFAFRSKKEVVGDSPRLVFGTYE